MDAPARPPVPCLDPGLVCRLRDAIAGGPLALGPDRELAARLLGRWPLLGTLVRGAHAFHSRAAAWAVSGGTAGFPVPPAAGVIFAASGYPLSPPVHAAAAAASPGARFVYAEADPWAHDLNRELLADADPARVAAVNRSSRVPAALMSALEIAALDGPLHLQLQLCAPRWPGEFAAWAVAEYARLLPPGSTLAMSVAVPGGGTGLDALERELPDAGERVHWHSAAAIARWIAEAGLLLVPPGITDVRARETDWAARRYAAHAPVMRIVEAVALRP